MPLEFMHMASKQGWLFSVPPSIDSDTSAKVRLTDTEWPLLLSLVVMEIIIFFFYKMFSIQWISDLPYPFLPYSRVYRNIFQVPIHPSQVINKSVRLYRVIFRFYRILREKLSGNLNVFKPPIE